MHAPAAHRSAWLDALRRLCAEWLFLHGHVGVMAPAGRASDDEESAPQASAAHDQARPDAQPERARRL